MKYRSANRYFKDRFGCKMYKASVSLNVTCPNRDGKCGVGGCIFCSEGGSGEFSEKSSVPVKDQIELAIQRVSAKTNSDTCYIAYFQSFTNTYCEPAYLENAINEALDDDRIKAVSIATRPDCLPEEILGVLKKTARKTSLFVELGLQTSNDDTAKFINRGYDSVVYAEAVSKLKSIGANVITHVIFGLPGETSDDMMNTVKYACDCGTDGIKFTCLYALSGTVIGKMYEEGKIHLLEEEEYFDLVEKALSILPENVVVHRLTGDGPKSLLLGPLWTANKRSVVNYINRRFKEET